MATRISDRTNGDMQPAPDGGSNPATPSDLSNRHGEAVLGRCNPQEAIARLGGHVDIYGETVAAFLKEEPDFVSRITNDAARGDLMQVRRTAHTLKGFAAMCGALGVSEAAANLERAAHDGRDDLPALAARLAREYAASRPILRPYCT